MNINLPLDWDWCLDYTGDRNNPTIKSLNITEFETIMKEANNENQCNKHFGFFTCTRPSGHSGLPHIATGEAVSAMWF